MRSGGSNAREKKAMRPPMVTRDTGALNEDLESEFVRIGKPWLCTATKGHALGRSFWSGNLRRRHTRAAHAKVNAIPNFRHPIAKKQHDFSPRLRLEMTFSIPETTR